MIYYNKQWTRNPSLFARNVANIKTEALLASVNMSVHGWQSETYKQLARNVWLLKGLDILSVLVMLTLSVRC